MRASFTSRGENVRVQLTTALVVGASLPKTMAAGRAARESPAS
jgi:hypothetical protein